MSRRLIAALDAVSRATFDLTGGKLTLLDLKSKDEAPKTSAYSPCPSWLALAREVQG